MITDSYLTTSNEIEQQAVHIIREFLHHAAAPNCPPLEWTFIKEADSPGLRQGAVNSQSIKVVKLNGTLHLSICSEDFIGIPAGALQGWLELEIIHAMVEADTNLYRFNFQNQILPLMPLSGSALYFIRELVEHLSRALKRLEATKIITKMDRGLPQVNYYFHTINPTAEDRKVYKKFMPHNWTRASHLCGKLGEYMALSYLTDQGVGFSHSLLSDWQKQYGYTEKDQAFMEEMAFIADHYQNREFSFRLVEMFKTLKESLLIAGSDDTTTNNPGLTV
jgi:hypothetical protein